MLPALAFVALSCAELKDLQDSVLSNLGDGRTLTIADVRSMHSRINDALIYSETCPKETSNLVETSFGLEEIMYQLNKSKEAR
jgi:hypothetical protein